MAYYTIKQLADEFNVTKQAIRYQITSKKLKKFTSKQNINGIDTLVVNDEGYCEIKKAYQNNNDKNFTSKLTSKVTSNKDDFTSNNSGKFDSKNTDKITSKNTGKEKLFTSKDVLSEKERTLSLLIKENEALHDEIKQLHTELQHEQELHLMDQKQVKALENKVKQLESPQEENKNEDIKKEPPAKKWWQFWK